MNTWQNLETEELVHFLSLLEQNLNLNEFLVTKVVVKFKKTTELLQHKNLCSYNN